MVVSLGNKMSFWLSAFSVMYRSGCSKKKRLCLACFPFNIWVGLKCRRVLWLVNAVFLLGNRGIQISQSSNMSSHMLGLFPDNKFIVLGVHAIPIQHLAITLWSHYGHGSAITVP